MTFDEFVQMALEAFPNAEVSTDNDGQLVIYTGFELKDTDDIVPIKNN